GNRIDLAMKVSEQRGSNRVGARKLLGEWIQELPRALERIVQMRPGRAPSRAHVADDLLLGHARSRVDAVAIGAQVAVAALEPIAVLDADHVAIGALHACDRDRAIGHSPDRGARGGAIVDALV